MAYQQQIPNSPGAFIGAGMGEIAPWALGIGEARAAGLIPKATSYLGKLRNLALEGGVIGATQPVNTGAGGQTVAGLVAGTAPAPSYLSQKAQQIGLGAATGPLAKLGVDSVGLLGSGVKNAIQHVANPDVIANQNVARLLGNNAAVSQSLRSAP